MKIIITRNIGQMDLTNEIVIVIDVIRAATVEAVALGQNASYIIPVATVKEAFELKHKNPSHLLIGENNGLKVIGFDYGNSPTEICKTTLKNKILIHRSSSGTKALYKVIDSKELIFGSFVTASAIVKYIKTKNPNKVILYAPDEDDFVCASYIGKLLQSRNPDFSLYKNKFYKIEATEWFRDSSKPEFPIEDLEFALKVDKFNFICLVKKTQNGLKTIKVTP